MPAPRKVKCKHGHPLSDSFIRWRTTPKGTTVQERVCRKCAYRHRNRLNAAKRAAVETGHAEAAATAFLSNYDWESKLRDPHILGHILRVTFTPKGATKPLLHLERGSLTTTAV